MFDRNYKLKGHRHHDSSMFKFTFLSSSQGSGAITGQDSDLLISGPTSYRSHSKFSFFTLI